MPAGDPPLTLRDLHAIDVARLRGVGDKRRAALAALGIDSVADLLSHYPRRYIDRRRQESIDALAIGDEATVFGEIRAISARRTRNRRSLVTATLGDGTGRLRLTFFNQPWRERQLPVGTRVVVFGRVETYRGQRQMTNPVVDLVGDRTGRIVAVYPQSDKAGVHSWDIAALVEEALARCRPRGLADPVPEAVRRRLDLVDRQWAIERIHRPATMGEVGDARRRLVFDELLRVQLELVRRKRRLEREVEGIEHRIDGPLLAAFLERLPFELTGAQRRAVDEILADLAAPHPMHRLLQGDVGAGKTLVAIAALLAAVDGGHQGALMAPTEVLAEQHHLGVRELLDGLEVADPGTLMGTRPLQVALLTNAVPTAERRRVLGEMATGRVDLVIGTHALIQEAVEFRDLGAVVIDEQHRFGVEQRAALRDKGDAAPDVLVMTATPIPRSAAMTVYGDLDQSVLDELPPGRTPIETRRVSRAEESTVWDDVRAAVAAGRQAYVVCPLIGDGKAESGDDPDGDDLASAVATHERLATGELAELRLGLLHGRLGPADKEATMEMFRLGHLDVLVATTVVEVGVDVPNATVMVILDADRFGIAQLHQLRGRVGRGRHASRCWLVADPTTPDGDRRLDALVASTDGFELAEIDLELRGEGTIMGERQKGRSDLKLASLRRDRDTVVTARRVAVEIIDDDPELERHPDLADELTVALGDEDAEFLLKG
ncbi:MAG: ATP-dependent DNA helicase RecG [Actinomyces sp.]|nr:MAG: ATP-dependent DNA helicase RecG [Actinomyces sp.]